MQFTAILCALYSIHEKGFLESSSCCYPKHFGSDVYLLLLQLAKAEKLKPMEVELKRLEDLADAIVNDFAYMRQREQEMRDTNGMHVNYVIIHFC